MSMLSVIIPSRNERFMPQTVDDLFKKASGEIEVIVVLDGYWPDPPVPSRDNLVFIHRGVAHGMRPAINAGAAVARGKYLMKCDAHCMFAEGFDEVLEADCEEDWLVIPRRYSLDAENWSILHTGKSAVDYEFLTYPYRDDGEVGMHGTQWFEKARENLDKLIDDDMSFQGSSWFMQKKLFDRIGPMQCEGYGTFMQEPQELGLKVWLGGGRQIRNKKTWYAHLHKGKQYGRGYSFDGGERKRGSEWCASYWLENRWEGQVHKFEWLIEKFWPIPTWTNDWKKRLRDRGINGY